MKRLRDLRLIATLAYFLELKVYWFVKNMAQFELYFFPVGTILGLYTLYFLSKTSVKSLYGIDSNR